ncbi:hypothetical protein PoB_005866700 [Plakobranchus ocellatus]|uniref:Uncharacterized protein n=1 Tax=Plakobranchus ocellatus TaxID=259542 RepID=A0AAV4CL16_9GAST|nr:hypothetical protein PoB_005866700 [Plakobranchus ocellatus]
MYAVVTQVLATKHLISKWKYKVQSLRPALRSILRSGLGDGRVAKSKAHCIAPILLRAPAELTEGVGGTAVSETCRDPSVTGSSPLPAPGPNGRAKSLRSPYCGLVMYKNHTPSRIDDPNVQS